MSQENVEIEKEVNENIKQEKKENETTDEEINVEDIDEVADTPKKPTSLEKPSQDENKAIAKSLFRRLIQIPKISSTELIKKVLTKQPLFKDIYTSDSFTDLMPDEKAEKEASILISGFGLKSLQELQKALDADAILKRKKTEAEQFPCVCSDESSIKSETLPQPEPPVYSLEERMNYLLKLEKYVEMEGEMGSIPPPPIEQEPAKYGVGDRGRLGLGRAKSYLKDHKIFQFFQFMLAHLLSALPEDPIDFLMSLLDRVLLYRTGLIDPPLLYEKKHIEQLFHLMDRFGQGYVDLQQYKTAMETLGICEYKQSVMQNMFGMVSKETFVEEIFNAEIALFNDLTRNRLSCTCDIAAPPPTVIEADLRAQSTSSSEASESATKFNKVESVGKFWAKYGEKQPRQYKGKFWSDFKEEVFRRDSLDKEHGTEEGVHPEAKEEKNRME